MRKTRVLARVALTPAILCGLLAATAAAHQVATTEVVLTLRGRSYEAVVSTDPESFHAKLAALQRPIADLVELRFDGRRVTPAIEERSASADRAATVRLSGTIPDGSVSVTWSTSLVFGSYPLSIVSGSSEPAVQWLQGTQASAPVQVPANGLAFASAWLALGALPVLGLLFRPFRR